VSFWQSFKYVHRESWAFLVLCPLLALVPVLAELAQHIGEMSIGMYAGPEAAQGVESHPLRTGLGLIKTVSLSLAVYWVVRFLAGGRDGRAARTAEPQAVKLFAIVLGLQTALAVLSLYIFTSGPVAVALAIFGFLFGILGARFVVAAPLGLWISPLTSFKDLTRHLLWGLAFTVVATLPLMAVHYALGFGAILAPEPMKWPILILDSLVVGWVAALLSAVVWVIANRSGPVDAAAGFEPNR